MMPPAEGPSSSPLTVVILGTGDAFSAERYSSALLVGADDESGRRRWLLVDCPHPIRKMLREATGQGGAEPSSGREAAGEPAVPLVDIGDLDACLLTHLHADHASGLEGLGFFSHFALGRRMPLYTHPDVLKDLWSGHLRAGMEHLVVPGARSEMYLDDYFAVSVLDERAPVTIGPFTVRCRSTFHHVPTFALKIEAGGRSVGYSADTAFDPGLITWLSDADLVVHETNLGLHTPYEPLAMLDDDLRRKMRLIAFPDGFDDEPRAIDCLHDGQVLSV